jgi:hypothetical protein
MPDQVFDVILHRLRKGDVHRGLIHAYDYDSFCQSDNILSVRFMDEVGPGFQPAGAFQAPQRSLTGKVPTPRRSAAAAQKG